MPKLVYFSRAIASIIGDWINHTGASNSDSISIAQANSLDPEISPLQTPNYIIMGNPFIQADISQDFACMFYNGRLIKIGIGPLGHPTLLINKSIWIDDESSPRQTHASAGCYSSGSSGDFVFGYVHGAGSQICKVSQVSGSSIGSPKRVWFATGNFYRGATGIRAFDFGGGTFGIHRSFINGNSLSGPDNYWYNGTLYDGISGSSTPSYLGAFSPICRLPNSTSAGTSFQAPYRENVHCIQSKLDMNKIITLGYGAYIPRVGGGHWVGASIGEYRPSTKTFHSSPIENNFNLAPYMRGDSQSYAGLPPQVVELSGGKFLVVNRAAAVLLQADFTTNTFSYLDHYTLSAGLTLNGYLGKSSVLTVKSGERGTALISPNGYEAVAFFSFGGSINTVMFLIEGSEIKNVTGPIDDRKNMTTPSNMPPTNSAFGNKFGNEIWSIFNNANGIEGVRIDNV